MKEAKKPFIFNLLKGLIQLLFITTFLLSSGCHEWRYGPPDHNVINPLVISVGSSGQVIASQENYGKGPVTQIDKIGPDGKTEWQIIHMDPSQPFKPYSVSPTQLVGDGKQNTFVVWGLGDDIWINKLDIKGGSVWKDKVKIGNCNRLYDLKAVSDGAGGAIVGYLGERGEFGLQRINMDGILLQSEKHMSDIAGFEITSNAVGDILLLHVNFSRSFYLQEIDLSGNNISKSPLLLNTHKPSPRISPTTIPVGNAGPEEYALWLIDDFNGGSIAGYSDTWGNTDEDRSLNIYKVDSDGNVLWTKRFISNSKDNGGQVIDYATGRCVGDGAGGIFIVSLVKSSSISTQNGTSLVIQRIDSSGNEALNTNDNQTDNTWNVNRARFNVISDDSGGIGVFWVSLTRNENNRETGTVIRAQKVERDGKKQWDEFGVMLSNDDVTSMNGYPSVVSDGSGGFIASLGNSAITGGRGSLVWRIGPDGKLIWKNLY